jgi:glucosamine 6-phosphate synthetase-like amidotransferase/phosphosugar isomerase protein|tara:strand:- start:477 stop:677 length:201 start_codon:yes stop_codon:yes gene_type:complete
MDIKSDKISILSYTKDFIFNALEDGWNVEKRENCYIFRKKHENKREYYLDSYLNKFIEKQSPTTSK